MSNRPVFINDLICVQLLYRGYRYIRVVVALPIALLVLTRNTQPQEMHTLPNV